MYSVKKRNIHFLLVLLLIFPLLLVGQRKELRAAEQAIDNEEFYIAKKLLEKAESAIKDMNSNLQARFYHAKGIAYLGLNADNYGNLEGLQKSREYFNKVIELGKKADGEYGLEAIKETLLSNALLDREEEDYENAYSKFYNLSQLYPKDTLYLFAAAANAFQAEDLDGEAIRLFEELKALGYEGNKMQYSAKNIFTHQRQFFVNKKERDQGVEAGRFEAPKDEEATSQEGTVLRFLAELYVRNDQREKAVDLLKGVDDDPEDVDLYRDYAFIHNTLGDKEQYREHLTTLLEKDKKNKMVYLLLLGEEMEKEGDSEKAQQLYENAVGEAPESSEAQLSMARFLLMKEEKIKEEIKKRAKEKGEDDSEVAILKEKQKSVLREALPYLEKTLELEPENMGVLRATYQASWMLQDQKKIRKYGRILKKEGEKLNAEANTN